MGEAQGPAKQLQFSVDGGVRLLVLSSRGDVGLDRSEGDLEGAPVPEMLFKGLRWERTEPKDLTRRTL